MSEAIERLREQRRQVLANAEAPARRAATDNRNLTAEEQRIFEQAMAEVDRIDARIDELRGQHDRVQQADDAFRRLGGGRLGLPSVEDREVADRLRAMVLANDVRPLEVRDTQPRSGWQPGIERRDLATTTGSAGLTGVTFYNRIIESLVEANSLLAAGATLITSESGETLRVPTGSPGTAGIVAEGAQIPSSDPALDSVPLSPFKYATIVYVSRELVEDATFDIAGYIARETGGALGLAAGNDFITGSGTGEPNGLLNAAVVGVTGAGATPTADELIDLFHSVASPYGRARSAAWLMSNAALAEVRKLKDPATGAFLFDLDVPVGTGASGQLLGRPVYVDAGMPDPAAGASSVAFGDMSRVFVRQVNGVRFDRSDDFRFDTDTVSFRAVWRADGALVDVNAVKLFAGAAA